MDKFIFDTKQQMGSAAAKAGAESIRKAIENKGSANIILATGASQFEMLSSLVEAEGIDWSKVSMFHLDEYIGIDISHPASFRKYLKERFADKATGLKAAYFVDGTAADPQAECQRLSKLIADNPIDVAFVGIGENCHLAFNDPPADFETDQPYIVVELDEMCRKQQLGEGWFPTLNDVPTLAISMSIKQILKSKAIVVTVPDERKAQAVKDMLQKDISNLYPASILRNHNNCKLFLDKTAASKL